jgi:hypothetical protein
LNSETATVLARLGEIEGVSYTHSILSSQPVHGTWLDWNLKEAPVWKGLHELHPNRPNEKTAVPRSRQLRADIEELNAKAEQLEREAANQAAVTSRSQLAQRTRESKDRGVDAVPTAEVILREAADKESQKKKPSVNARDAY